MNKTITAIDVEALEKKANGNIYEAVVVMAQRARQLNTKQKREMLAKMAQFSPEIYDAENRVSKAQADIVRYYEKLPKPNLQAIEAFKQDDITYAYKIDTDL